MFGSTYQTLLKEEKSLPRPNKGEKFPLEVFLEKIVKPRAAFANKIKSAYNSGKITKSEHDELINLNRQHSLNI